MTFEILKHQNGQDTEYAAYANGVLISTYDTPQEAQEAIVAAEKADTEAKETWIMVQYLSRAALTILENETEISIVPFSSSRGPAPMPGAIKKYLVKRGVAIDVADRDITLASHVLVLKNGKGHYRVEFMPCDEHNQTMYGDKQIWALDQSIPAISPSLD